ncbi:MAG TPA: ribosome small subunit-dependent GTPase A [Haliscomenobacter sp.]|uniref:ribosome small subunit-dependent GTPase A n=1 Tax=Haliscomenobacter sp. TaxID=2717303 RepID=UPI002B63FB98|nr:ribosome small subunit-dependent GTPase A [Haliscomenobacter sp.]HOY16872.1 ribosome small subunit-dependent GTPase A [Haliscomenobacter sp.]HPH17923.1 ribosome small subunit-dependent GTPase A [Haliscomenobacter sp.]
MQGIVIKSTGSWYQVRLEDGEVLDCRVVGKLRLNDLPLTNPIAVGDEVSLEMENETGNGLIKGVLPRKNYVVRQSPHRKHELHLLASNIDQALLVTTITNPRLKPGFIDRFLLMVEPYEIPTIIVFNKADLYEEADFEVFAYMEDLYQGLGYTVILASAKTGDGVKELKALLKDKVTMLSGQSGVGKSSLLNQIQASLQLRVGDISEYSGKGQHTTTFAEMHPLDFGGQIIDTPGIKTLGFIHLEPNQIAHNFREFFALSSQCRFGGACLHRNEPNCAVKAALEKEEISPLRYENYLYILQEIEDLNHWERKKNM